VGDALRIMGRAFSHMLRPENADLLAEVQTEVDKRWARIKAMAASEVL
jgi:pyruvate ferredoxin oxidoreductase alpha subunit